LSKLYYRSDIDGLRAVAILLVVIFHVFPEKLVGGFIGVDVFFVISGYLITGIILDSQAEGTLSLKQFYYRRIRRLFPSLMLVLAFTLIAGYFLLNPSELYRLSKNLLGGLVFVSNFTLWSDAGYFNIFSERIPLLHLWSLGVEEQFYFIWPPLLIIITRYAKQFLVPVIGSCLLVSFMLNVVLVTRMPDLTFYFPITRFWEIAVGALISTTQQSRGRRELPGLAGDAASIAGLLCIVVSALAVNSNNWYPGWWGLLPVIGAVLVIQAGPNSLCNRYILSRQWMIWLGLISYPLYLWHWPLVAYFNIAGISWEFGTEKFLILGSSLILAWASYRLVELPVKNLRIGQVVRYSVATAVLLFGVTLSVFLNEGLPERFNGDVDYPLAITQLGSPGFGGYIAQDWRDGTCFLTRGQRAEEFSNSCLEQGDDGGLLFLWGDSHAAALSPGLRMLANSLGFGFAQYTASACAPLLDWNGEINPLCESINETTLDMIRATSPDVVVLQAAWYWTEYNWQALENTLVELSALGVPKIVLLGAAPSWTDTVPNIIYSYFGVYESVPPQTTYYKLDTQAISNFDYRLERMAERHGVTFKSLVDIFCDGNGCMLYLDNILDVTSLDGGHLSEKASVYAARALAPTLFNK
jgi:peptidoglycan/LPS O-acetylase OafA/YrhL